MKKTTIGKTGFSQTRMPTSGEQKGFDPSRAAPETQIARLNASIVRDLNRLAGMVRAGQYERAAERTVHVARNVATIRNLAKLVGDRQSEPPVPAPAPTSKSGLRTKTKPKTFKRWSEK